MKDSQKKAKKLESKGNKLLGKKKYSEALDAFEEALQYDSENPELLDKLIETHERSSEEWGLEDFTKQVTWTMQKQELDNPRIKRLHEKLSPEFQKITELILEFAKAEDEESEEKLIDKLLPHGEKALVPLIEFIRTLKHQENKELNND